MGWIDIYMVLSTSKDLDIKMSSTYFDSPWFEFLGKRWTNLKVGFLFLRFVFGHFSMLIINLWFYRYNTN